VIGLDTRVRLAAKAKLRFDERSGRQMLLYPERGLELSDSAARIAVLCREDGTVNAIVDALVSVVDAPRARIEADVLSFLRQLEERGLLVVSEP
jgi:coenzyme PQQ biosynthesis protein PqqD